MPSAIDPTKPVTGNPTTESVRDNFAAAKSEIEVLQATAGVGPQGPVGPTGPAGSITVNPTVITGLPGTNASVTVGGTPQAATLQFTVPRGDTGTGGSGITETQAKDAVRQGQVRFEEATVTTASIWPTTPNVAATPPTPLNAGWTTTASPELSTSTFTHAVGGGAGVLAYPLTITNGAWYQIIFTMSNVVAESTAVQSFFAVYLRTGPTVTAAQQLVTSNVNAGQTIVVQATANFTHLVIVPVTGWQGSFTLTRVVQFVGSLNSDTFSLKNWPVVVQNTSLYEGGGGRLATGANNIAIGPSALNSLTTGVQNIAFGYQALYSATTLNYNVAIGDMALYSNLTGGQNIGIGRGALQTHRTGTYNVALGYFSQNLRQSGNHNTALGSLTLRYNTTGLGNVAVGSYALYTSSINNSYNVAMGYYPARYYNGNNSVIIGDYAIYGGTGAGITTGSNIVAIGSSAARFIANGTIVNADGGNSVFIGSQTKSSATGQTNQIVIGYNAIGGGSNTITLGNGEITQLRCNVQTIAALSDSRVKEDIHPADLNICLDAVRNLPVNRWRWQPIAGFRRDHNVTGFLSGDLKKVFPHAVSVEDEYLTVRDADGNPVYKTVTEVLEPDEEGGQPTIQTREIQETMKIESLARVELTEVLPTLWGAVQQLIQRIEQLEKPGGASGNPSTESKGGFFRGKK